MQEVTSSTKHLALFGSFNHILDELIHILLSALAAYIGYLFGLSLVWAGIVFLVGILIDLDHVLNPLVGKFMQIKATILPSIEQNGVTIKVLHGIDLFLMYAMLAFASTDSVTFAVFVFISLTLHHLWDYLAYDHHWKELFFTTRLATKFNPGRRDSHVGWFFHPHTLPR